MTLSGIRVVPEPTSSLRGNVSASSLRARVHNALPLWYAELQQLRQAQNQFRDAGIAFIHVPRTAGLSISRTVYGSTVWCHFTLAQFMKGADHDVRTVPPRFAVVRNPWDRVVSAYHFAKQGGVEGGATMRRPHHYRGEDFATFDTFVRRFLAVRNVWKLDGVFRPQTYYLGRDSRHPINHIGHFDRLAETEHWLSETLGRHIKFERTNATERDGYRSYYSAATRNIVAEAYRPDIERFGFSF